MTNKSLLAMLKMTIMTVVSLLTNLQKIIEDEINETN